VCPTLLSSGLTPNTKYFYKCGDPSQGEMSEEYNFTTLPLPGPDSYPSSVAILGDLGLTYNSSTTLDHIILNNPSLLLLVGDLSYANNYLTTGESAACYSCSFPTAPTHETYQPHWDNWGRYFLYSG
jgi:phosphodiesterase/alkaline phosphatase D-like protein